MEFVQKPVVVARASSSLLIDGTTRRVDDSKSPTCSDCQYIVVSQYKVVITSNIVIILLVFCLFVCVAISYVFMKFLTLVHRRHGGSISERNTGAQSSHPLAGKASGWHRHFFFGRTGGGVGMEFHKCGSNLPTVTLTTPRNQI